MENKKHFKKASLLTKIILGSAAVVAFSGCETYYTEDYYDSWDRVYREDSDRRYWFNYNRSRLWKEPIHKPPYFKPRAPQPRIQRPTPQRTPQYRGTQRQSKRYTPRQKRRD